MISRQRTRTEKIINLFKAPPKLTPLHGIPIPPKYTLEQLSEVTGLKKVNIQAILTRIRRRNNLDIVRNDDKEYYLAIDGAE